MRSTKGSALDPTRAGSSGPPPPPVRPPLHLASTSVLFGRYTVCYSFGTPLPLARLHTLPGPCGNSSDIRMAEPPFQMGLMPDGKTYCGKTTPTEKPMREFAPFMHVAPSGHMGIR